MDNAGRLLAVGLDPDAGADKLFGQCYLADGGVQKPKFIVGDGEGFTAASIFVAMSKATGLAATLSLVHLDAAGSDSFDKSARILYRAYNKACQPLTVPIVPSSASARIYRDVSIDDAGRHTLVWAEVSPCLGCPGAVARNTLAVLDETAALVVSPTQLGPGLCKGLGVHVATNPTSGDFITTCQGDIADPIYYRRFAAGGAPLDPAMMLVEHTQGASSGDDTHAVGMQQDGRFAVVWIDEKGEQFEANLYDDSGALTHHTVLGDIYYGAIPNRLAGLNVKIQSKNGDWLLPWTDTMESLHHVTRFDPDNNILAVGDLMHDLVMLTMDGAGSHYVHGNTTAPIAPIMKDVVPLLLE